MNAYAKMYACSHCRFKYSMASPTWGGSSDASNCAPEEEKTNAAYLAVCANKDDPKDQLNF